LAHVVRQQGGKATAPQSKNDAQDGLEDEADVAAVGAVSSMWLGTQGLDDIGRNALPRMRSGLKLQRCTKHSLTNRGTIVKTRESGHGKEIIGPYGRPEVIPADNLTEKQADKEISQEQPRGLLSKITKLGKPTNDYDCHGYTFLNGEKWIDNDQVPAILNDNGYLETQTPAVGDIVIYVFGGKLVHSGVITEVKGGIVTKITSKWGRWGLYSHAPDDVPTRYGTWFPFHTTRPGGHKLRRQK
jgi:hypothetical protein